jgi:hypothetical protein
MHAQPRSVAAGDRSMKTSRLYWTLAASASVVGIAAYASYIARPKRAALPAASATYRTVAGIRSVAKPGANGGTKPIARARGAYEQAIRSNLFSAPQPIVVTAKPVPPTPAPRIVVPPAPAPDPLADLVYAGSVTVDGKTSALIESRASREGDYVVAGGRWRQFEVVSITPQQLTLMVDGAPRVVVVSDALNVVPLSASAPAAAPAGTPGAEGSAPPPQGVPAPQRASAATRMKRFMDFNRATGALIDERKSGGMLILAAPPAAAPLTDTIRPQ